MPKVTMTFNLPEERYEHNCAIHGTDWKSIICEIAIFVRNKLKYGHEYKTADEVLEAIKTEIWNECQESGLDPWED